jgi:spore photoproduct lyase
MKEPVHCSLRARRKKFVEIFRTTPPKTVCPNFYVLAHANGCIFQPQCTYCFLKSSFWYLSGPQAFSNTGRMRKEIARWMQRDDLESFVLNMGNLSDSLVFEKHRPLIAELVELFREEAEAKGRKHALLLVTKGGVRDCKPLLEAQPCRNVIVSFSVNAPEAARIHEKGAAPVADRLQAAARLKSRGWRIRMRIDPMILGFDYRWIAEQVRRLAPERVTLGTLRAEHNLPRYVGNGLLRELEAPADAKSLARYPKELRLALYRQAADVLSKDKIPLALCEETLDIWQALGFDAEAKKCNCAL